MNNKVLLIPIIGLLLTACGNNQYSNNSNHINDDSCFIKNDVTIEFLCLTDSNYKKELNRMIEEFKEIEPHVTVNLTNPPAAGSYNVLEKTVISGFFKEDYPDIVQCFPDNVVKYIDYKGKNYVVNLDDYLNNPNYGLSDKDDYNAEFLKEGSSYAKEGIYSLPFCKSTELMYYNADVLLDLDLSGVDNSINNGKPLDEDYLDNLTWDELLNKLCPAIKTYNYNNRIEKTINVVDEKGEPVLDELGEAKTTTVITGPLYYVDSSSGIVTYDSDENFFITLANQYGYGYTSVDQTGKGSIDFDNANMKNLVRNLNQSHKDGYLQTRASYGDYVSDLFIHRKSLFTISSTAGLSYNIVSDRDEEQNGLSKFKLGVARLPHAENKEYTSINQGASICILDHQDNDRALASYLFWKHITNKANAASWAVETGYMGIRNSVYTSEKYLAKLEPQDLNSVYDVAVSDNLKKIDEVKNSTFTTAVFRGSGNARTNVGLLLEECLKENDLESKIDELFANYAKDSKQYLTD